MACWKAEGTERLRGALPYPPALGIQQSSLISHFHILDLLRHYSFLFEAADMPTGVGMSSCCISGAVHEGTPKGRVDTISAELGGRFDGEVNLFGWEVKNVRLLADNYAKAGLYCYIPDVHQGDSPPIPFLQNTEPPFKDRENASVVDKTKSAAIIPVTLGPWLYQAPRSRLEPLISSFINTVCQIPGTNKARGKKEGSVGGVDAAYTCHPSLVAIPGDFSPVTRPLSLVLGDQDSLLDQKSVGQIQDVVVKKTDVLHGIRIYEGQVHGFALRSDWSSDRDKKAMNDAEK